MINPEGSRDQSGRLIRQATLGAAGTVSRPTKIDSCASLASFNCLLMQKALYESAGGGRGGGSTLTAL